MIAYLRLLLLRTLRTNWGLGALVLAAGLPLSVVLASRYQGAAFAASETQREEMFFTAAILAVFPASLGVVNLTALAVYEEKQRGRSKLLRVASVDGFRAVAAYLSYGGLLAFGLTLAGFAAFAWDRVLFPVIPAAWPAGLLFLGLFASVFAPLGLWIGYLLPRGAAIVGGFVATVMMFWGAGVMGVLGEAVRALSQGVTPASVLVLAALAHGLTLLVLPILWRRTASRLW